MAALPFDLLTNAAPLLKRYYDDRRVYNMAFKNRPLYAWMPKKTGVVGGSPASTPGHGYQMPITIDDIPGESATFVEAVDARDGDSHEVWSLNRVKRYATATLDWETIRAMKNDMGAFMRALTPRIDSAINQVANTCAAMVYGDGTGARGVSTAITAGAAGTVVLTNATEARRFSLRRTCVLVEEGDAGGSVLTGSAKITAINLETFTLTFDTVPAGWATAGTAGAGNFLFVIGDAANGATTSLCQDGLGSWGPLPSSVSAGQFFKGVERAKYKERLLMLDYDATGALPAGGLSEVVRTAAAKVQANEGSPDALFLGPMKWAALETNLASQSRYEMMMGSDAKTGFDSIVINAGGGKINVVSDPWCPEDRGYLLQKETWEFFSIDRFPDFVSDDGNKLHKLERADEVEFRLGGYYNVACRAPGHNMTIRFA